MVGNLKNYTKIDILRCLLRIEKPVSRLELSKILELGEGTVRSILDILKEKGFLDSNKNGHYLSDKGSSLISKIKDSIVVKEAALTNIFPKQKNIAVKNGAEGAIIIRYGEDKKLKIFDSEYKEDFSEIESKFDLNYGNIVVVAYADSYRLAEHGALAVAVELNNDLSGLIDRFK